MPKQATFTEMLNGTAEDYAIIGQQTSEYATQLPDRILEHLSILKGDTGGFAVDRFTHCLQTATRAFKDGRDEEYVVCALLHDIGDTIASAEAIVSPISWSKAQTTYSSSLPSLKALVAVCKQCVKRSTAKPPVSPFKIDRCSRILSGSCVAYSEVCCPIMA